MGESIPVEKLVRVFVKIRDARSTLKAKFDEEDNALKDKLDTIRQALLDHCKEHQVESVRTTAGIFYRSVKRRYWTSDWESMHQFILEHGEPGLLDKRINQTNMRQFLEENPDVMPKGLNADTEYTISVRKA
jgi:aspartate/tyrosine/aromatic aminotransferase